MGDDPAMVRRPRRIRSVRALAAFVAFAVLAGCTGGGDALDGSSTTAPGASAVGPSRDTSRDTAATFVARGSVNQLFVTDATPDAELEVVRDGRVIATGRTDRLGSLVVRDLPRGAGVIVREAGEGPRRAASPVEVLDEGSSTPPASFYRSQRLGPGFGYLTTRDGTTLSVNVVLPGPPEDGPYPTVVEYSGYDPSRPGVTVASRLAGAGLNLTSLCPGAGELCREVTAQPGSTLAALLGYAVVGVNVRGTGCSGGAYDFFEPLQVLDGYDVIETVAAQPWVAGNGVGMVGLSYPGLAQLWVAAARPPSLASIAPMSALADTYRSTLAPGGIVNDGFAVAWAEDVGKGAAPYGQGWERARVDAGDTTCRDNQKLREQRVDRVSALAAPHYDPPTMDRLNPSLFVPRIEVPVFFAAAFQDEQTGGHVVTLLERFTGAPFTKAVLYNGMHADGFAPQVLMEWKAFLDFTVRGTIAPVPLALRLVSPLLARAVFGADAPLPPDRWADATDVAAARSAWLAEPSVRVILESGAGGAPGAPVGRFQLTFPSWPPPSAVATRWNLSGTTLTPAASTPATPTPTTPKTARQPVTFRVDGSRSHVTNHTGSAGALTKALPRWQWTQPAPGTAARFTTEPLSRDLLIAGTGSVDLSIASGAADLDLEVLLTEIRADGNEVYIQSGWLRANARALAPGTTPLRPQHSYLSADASPMPVGTFTPVRVELFPVAHVVRAGSSLRLTVASPGGNRPRWTFRVQGADGSPEVRIGTGTPDSALVLPVVEGIGGWPATAPPCPSLRGQPCRRDA
jgi:predicted acyl esterase